MAGWIQLESEVPNPEEVSAAKLDNFYSGTVELWMRENSVFLLVPVKYTLACRVSTLAVLGHTTHYCVS